MPEEPGNQPAGGTLNVTSGALERLHGADLMAYRYQSRDAWLDAATNKLRPDFQLAGFPLPTKVRCSVGFPSTGRKGKRIGEHWPAAASADGHHEIFIRADHDEPAEVLGILAHELVHAALPVKSGHGPVFKRAALAVGLTGKMRETNPGAVLAARLALIAADLGPLPHGRLDIGQAGGGDDTPKQQGTRLLKADCAACGYTVRVTRKWLDRVGAPCCPKHGAMIVEGWEAAGEGKVESNV